MPSVLAVFDKGGHRPKGCVRHGLLAHRLGCSSARSCSCSLGCSLRSSLRSGLGSSRLAAPRTRDAHERTLSLQASRGAALLLQQVLFVSLLLFLSLTETDSWPGQPSDVCVGGMWGAQEILVRSTGEILVCERLFCRRCVSVCSPFVWYSNNPHEKAPSHRSRKRRSLSHKPGGGSTRST